MAELSPIVTCLSDSHAASGHSEGRFVTNRGRPLHACLPVLRTVTLPPDAQAMRATLADFEVPSDRVTTYMCKYLQPPSDRKYHIYDAQLVGWWW